MVLLSTADGRYDIPHPCENESSMEPMCKSVKCVKVGKLVANNHCVFKQRTDIFVSGL